MAFLNICSHLKQVNLPKLCCAALKFRQNIAKLSLKSKPTYTTQKRTFIFRKTTMEEYKAADNIPEEYTLIYRTGMATYLRFARIISVIGGCFVSLVVLLKSDLSSYDFSGIQFNEKRMKPKTTTNEVSVYLGTLMVFIVAVHYMLNRTPIRIYYLKQQKRYIFVSFGSLPFSTKKVACKAGDLREARTTSHIFPWSEDNFWLKGQKILLFENYFRRPADLYVLLGIQSEKE